MPGRGSKAPDVRVRGCVALILLAACSSRSLTPDAGSAPDRAATDTAAETSTPDAADVTDIASERTEGGGRCTRTDDRATIEVRMLDGTTLSCSSTFGDAGTIAANTWVGKVTDSNASSLVINDCGSDPTCDPNRLRIVALASGLDLTHFPREWVQVQVWFSQSFGCRQFLEITAVAPRDGLPPSRPAGQLLLAVVDGVASLKADSYAIEPARLGCSMEKGCGSPTPDEYAFDFTGAPGTAPLRVYMGDTVTWTGGATPLRFRNLRSYQSTVCDDYLNWAYTIYLAPK